MNAALPALAALALLAAAGPAAAQSGTAPTPPATPAAQPPAAVPSPQPLERGRLGGSTLNLQLDDASRRRIMSGATEEGSRKSGNLPSLGDGARPLDHTQRSSPYPKMYGDIEAPH